MQTYNFRNGTIPDSVKMFDREGNELYNLNEYGRCAIIKIYDHIVAIELNMSYKNDYKNLRVCCRGGFFMPNIPENTGIYKLEFCNNSRFVWKAI